MVEILPSQGNQSAVKTTNLFLECTGKYHLFVVIGILILMLHTCSNTDSNKLVIFSGVRTFVLYGDNYIVTHSYGSTPCTRVCDVVTICFICDLHISVTFEFQRLAQ